jgi:hypothetical protein
MDLSQHMWWKMHKYIYLMLKYPFLFIIIFLPFHSYLHFVYIVIVQINRVHYDIVNRISLWYTWIHCFDHVHPRFYSLSPPALFPGPRISLSFTISRVHYYSPYFYTVDILGSIWLRTCSICFSVSALFHSTFSSSVYVTTDDKMWFFFMTE